MYHVATKTIHAFLLLIRILLQLVLGKAAMIVCSTIVCMWQRQLQPSEALSACVFCETTQKRKDAVWFIPICKIDTNQYSSIVFWNRGGGIKLSLFNSPNDFATAHSSIGPRRASRIMKQFQRGSTSAHCFHPIGTVAKLTTWSPHIAETAVATLACNTMHISAESRTLHEFVTPLQVYNFNTFSSHWITFQYQYKMF